MVRVRFIDRNGVVTEAEGEAGTALLDLATGVTRTSRLSCQVLLTDELDGLEVRIPAESRDMQKR